MRSIAICLAAAALTMPAWAAGACEAPAPPAGQSPLQSRRPVIGDDVRLTSGFGMRRHPLLQATRMHTGVDWAAPVGAQVVAAGAGRVAQAQYLDAYGNTVVIDHGAGWQTLYAQLSAFDTKEGDCVVFGAPIGKVGSTGISAGPHLHFEVRQGGSPIDPMQVRTPGQPADADTK